MPLEWVAGESFGGYVVMGSLGQGGMGVVYHVRNTLMERSYAVKRAHLKDAASQRRFLTELVNWFDLPRHPHLVECQFFRTLQSDVAIFAELVDGGSVRDAIEAGTIRRLEQILDVAIQSAWGLQIAHECGLVHQDVKPGNMLVGSDGIVKVTDFGLATALVVSGVADTSLSKALVSRAGMTLAYRSPEQSRREAVCRATDVWSWGVSILHMVLGEVTWQDGTFAREVLADSLKRRRSTGHEILQQLADVLQRCFCEDPNDRWTALDDAAADLRRLHLVATGHAYARPRPPGPMQGKSENYDRRLTSGIRWQPPGQRLREAFRGSRLPVPTLDVPVARRARGKAVADLIGFRDCLPMIESTFPHKASFAQLLVVTVLLDMAFAEEWLGNVSGAIAAYDRATKHCKKLMGIFPVPGQIESLGTLYVNKAKTLKLAGDLVGADALLSDAIALAEPLLGRDISQKDQLAAACNNKAEVVRQLHGAEASLPWYDRAITLRTELLPFAPSVAAALAQVYLNKAEALKSLGRSSHASEAYDSALQLIPPVDEYRISAVLLGKGDALRIEGRLSEATACAEQVLSMRRRLAASQTDWALSASVAEACLFKGTLLQDQPRTRRAAIELLREGVSIYEGLLEGSGMDELAFDLFEAYTRLAACLQLARHLDDARTAFDRAFALLDRLPDLFRQGARRMSAVALACFNRALVAEHHREFVDALRFYDRALDLWRSIPPHAQAEVKGDVAKTRLFRAHLAGHLQPTDEVVQERRDSFEVLRLEADRTGNVEWRTAVELAMRERWLEDPES